MHKVVKPQAVYMYVQKQNQLLHRADRVALRSRQINLTRTTAIDNLTFGTRAILHSYSQVADKTTLLGCVLLYTILGTWFTMVFASPKVAVPSSMNHIPFLSLK